MKRPKTIATIEYSKGWSGHTIKIRDNRTVIIEKWSQMQGCRTGSKYVVAVSEAEFESLRDISRGTAIFSHVENDLRNVLSRKPVQILRKGVVVK